MSHNWQEKVKIFEYWLRDLLTKGLFLENCRQFPTFHNGSHSEKIHRNKTSLDLKPCVVFSSKMFLGKEKSYVIDYKTHQVKNACVNFNLWPLLFYFFYDKNAQSSENAKLRKNTIWIQMFFSSRIKKKLLHYYSWVCIEPNSMGVPNFLDSGQLKGRLDFCGEQTSKTGW